MLGRWQNLRSIATTMAQSQCKSQEFLDGVFPAGNVSSPKYDCYPFIVTQSALQLAALKVELRRTGNAHSSYQFMSAARVPVA